MFLRAHRVCSPEFLDEEINYIFYIGVKLKYPWNFREICQFKTRKIFYRSNNRNNNDNIELENMLVLSFNEKLEKSQNYF